MNDNLSILLYHKLTYIHLSAAVKASVSELFLVESDVSTIAIIVTF